MREQYLKEISELVATLKDEHVRLLLAFAEGLHEGSQEE